jgi:CheY-like chemotaxis protein
METLGNLAGGVAHDLNNILGILVGYSELLSDEIDENSPLRKHVQTIMNSGERAAAVVQDLLTLARRGVVIRQTANLNRIVHDQLKTPELLELTLSHPRIRIKPNCDEDLLNIKGSTVHISATLTNLVINAAEAMPGGGVIRIWTENRHIDRPLSGYEEVQKGDYAVLSVSDMGSGISPEDLKHIFEPFYTRKVMGRSGSGLGLSVVWGTMKDHDGYIDVTTERGKGTTFTLYFPVTPDKFIREEKIPVSEYLGKCETILVVDDEVGQRELATRMLTKLNYKATSVSNGEEAVEYLKQHDADLVVLDMIMDPGIDGYETYRRIMELKKKQKAILVSGFTETERVRMARELGAGAFLKKPFLQERLGLAVKKELDRE